MQTKMTALCRGRLLLSLLLTLAVILPAFGCAANYPGSYRSDFQGTYYGPRVNVRQWRIEHNLLNSKYQKLEPEAWEEDSPG
jgi:hypothetical protein